MGVDYGADPDELLHERGVVVDWAAVQERVGGYDPALYALVMKALPDADAVLTAEAQGRPVPSAPRPQAWRDRCDMREILRARGAPLGNTR